MLKGVLLGFACYAAYAISDAFVKSLHGGLPAFEAVFFGAVLMLSALPLIRRPGDRWIEVFQARKPSLWWIRAVSGAVCNITAASFFRKKSSQVAVITARRRMIMMIPRFCIFVIILSALPCKNHRSGW